MLTFFLVLMSAYMFTNAYHLGKRVGWGAEIRVVINIDLAEWGSIEIS